MSKIWIKANYVPHSRSEYIIQGKWYPEERANHLDSGCVDIISETGKRFTCRPESCLHLDGRPWTVHYGDTPPIENNWIVEECKAAKAEVLHWPEWRKDAAKHSTTYSVCKLEDKPTQWAEVYPKTSSELPTSNDRVGGGSKVVVNGKDVSSMFEGVFSAMVDDYEISDSRTSGEKFMWLLVGLTSGKYTIIDNQQEESNNEEK